MAESMTYQYLLTCMTTDSKLIFEKFESIEFGLWPVHCMGRMYTYTPCHRGIYLCRLHAYDFCLFDVCMRVFVARLVYLLLLRLFEHTAAHEATA